MGWLDCISGVCEQKPLQEKNSNKDPLKELTQGKKTLEKTV